MSSTPKAKVLVVDDDRLFREILAESLRNEGYAVETAPDGIEALDKFRKQGFEVVVTDLEMPRMAGEALAAAIKGGSPGTVVIAVTGDPELPRVRALLEAGCEGLLSKLRLDVAQVVKVIEAGRRRQRIFQAAAAHDLLERARREVAAGLAEATGLLVRDLERLAQGTAGTKSAAELAARSLAAARRIQSALERIESAGRPERSGAADAEPRAAEDAADYGKEPQP